jgi:hypothetical protein
MTNTILEKVLVHISLMHDCHCKAKNTAVFLYTRDIIYTSTQNEL